MRKRLLALVMASMFAFSILPSDGSFMPTNSNPQDGRSNPAFAFDQYHDYMDIKTELERISAEYSNITQIMTLGKTWEGRDIMALRLTDKPDENEADEPSVLIMGGHHANELPSSEVPMYILEFLVSEYQDNVTVREWVDTRDIWFVPLVNPDGREYAMNSDPTWRKNRSPIDTDGDGTPEGIGVDLNRNYGHLWGEVPGTSHNPADSNYCGPTAFSENETQAISKLALAVNFSISVSYHTYGDVIYYPWNNGIDTLSPKGDLLEAIAGDLGHLTGYVPMQGNVAYPTTGDSDDWLYADTECLPFTIEMGTQFIAPAGQLLSMCKLNLDAALYAIDIAPEPEKTLLPDWTFMVYMSSDADDGLAAAAFEDLNEMEVAGSTQDVNIIVLYDGTTFGDSKIYRIEKDPGGLNTAIISPTVDDMGVVIDPATRELDMSYPTVLRSFVNWTTANYPAQKYLLGFWGHGDGVLRQFVPDNGRGMIIRELNQALVNFHLDIVGFDTCSLGHFEVASELFSRADIMIGSEAEEPLTGWNYAASLLDLTLRPWMRPRELASEIVSDYLASTLKSYITQAAIDLSVLRYRLMPAMENFVAVASDFAYLDYAKYWQARNLTSTFLPSQDAVDLFEFLGRLRDQNVSTPVMNRIDEILKLRDELVIHSGTGSLYPQATTMAVYFPALEEPISPIYLGYKFLDTGWDDYLALMKTPPPRPVISHTPGYVANNTVGPYNITAEIIGAGQGPFTLFYRQYPQAWQSVSMHRDGDVLFGEIPGQADGELIEYYILDTVSQVTEPYEIKWGSQAYFNFTVFVTCDISLKWVQVPPETAVAGNFTLMKLNCSNAGPEPAIANITLRLISDMEETVLAQWNINLSARGYEIVEFNWTAESGNWTVEADAVALSVDDSNVSNQFALAWINVTAPISETQNFLAEYGLVIVLLVFIWAIPAIFVIHTLRKSRRRRRETTVQSLKNAREFLETTRDFGADITEASILLARAEAALAGNALPQSEKLISRARESAMNAVGIQSGGHEKQGGVVP
ncbi:MAG: hypothetical protein KKH41_07240 [Candidatus Thermoplasmatota archaeon]|nr:hypothetical protein [Candidatus Thermoplasmatota archaeon]MBU4071906.1 hypothetical protein [Candidatus Thermoplasmatota archaeon]MBU4143334.1 hypothetical protein [Candidatus Thermoplasmatota archaeon]MBU4592361.1 hypothetical protein [Candidatus Thermoplasmatota archaeon]